MDETQDRLNQRPRARQLLNRLTMRGQPPLAGLAALLREESVPATLLCVCPVTPAVVEAALAVADEADFPLVFAATLNQVDQSGGYTGWSPQTFIRFLEHTRGAHGYTSPVFVGLDHGGPWCRDDTRDLGSESAMQAARSSIEACLDAGYTHLHLDASLDPAQPDGMATEADLLARTVALLSHAEAYRTAKGLPPVSYEVSAEAEKGVHGDASRVETFVRSLVSHIKGDSKPLFVVANLGTDLHSPTFDAAHARHLSERLRPYGVFLKGHFTDFVSELDRYPASGVVAANLGPELAAVEYRCLRELADMARAAGQGVPFEECVIDLLDASGRWRKWLHPEEAAERLVDLSEGRRSQIVETASRYVLNDPRVSRLRRQLYDAVSHDISPEQVVREGLLTTLRQYVTAFRLNGVTERLLRDG